MSCVPREALFLLALAAGSAHGAVFDVTNLADSGAGSLRQAILAAEGSADAQNIIQFQPGLTGTVALSSALPVISKSLEIRGPGAAALTLDGQNASRVFFVGTGAVIDVTIRGMSLINGEARGGDGGDGRGGGGGGLGAGGALLVNQMAAVTIEDVAFVGNRAAGGAGGASLAGSQGGGGGGGLGGAGGDAAATGGGGGGGFQGAGGDASGPGGAGGGGFQGAGGSASGPGGGGGGGRSGVGGSSNSPGGGGGGGDPAPGAPSNMGNGGPGGAVGGGAGGNAMSPGQPGTAAGGGGGGGGAQRPGGAGNVFGGGGGGGDNPGMAPGATGGVFGGGGGGGNAGAGGPGGDFGGGGGSGAAANGAGAGGFGAGGGGGGAGMAPAGPGGLAGFGGGTGGDAGEAGGGGSAFGGAVFVRQGGILLMRNSSTIGSTLVAGTGSQAGAVAGTDLYLDGNQVAVLDVNQMVPVLMTGTIAGDGGIRKVGPGTLILQGDNTYLGLTEVIDGTLVVNGNQPASATMVQVTGILSGSGTLGATQVNGGIVSPGPGIATLNVQGNLTLDPGATLQVDTAGTGAADRVAVTGTANLGGLLEIRGTTLNPLEYLNRTYTVVTAGAGVNGSFTETPDDLRFLVPVVNIAPDRVDLSFVLDADPILALTDTFNGGTLLGALIGDVASGSSTDEERLILRQLFDLGLAEGDVRSALRDLAGVTLSAGTQTVLDTGRAMNGRVLASMGSLRLAARASEDGRGDPGAPARSFAPGVAGGFFAPGILGGAPRRLDPGERGPLPQETGSTTWATGFGHWGDIDPTAQSLAVDTRGQGVVLGHTWGDDDLVYGLHAGVADSQATVPGRRDRTDVQSVQAGAHAGWSDDDFYVDGSLDILGHEFDSVRQVTFGTIDSTPRSEHDGHELSLALESGYAYRIGGPGTPEGRSWYAQPQVGLYVRNLSEDGFTETGGDPANLIVADSETHTFQSAAGIGFFRRVPLARGGLLVPELRVRWTHEHGDRDRNLTTQFAGGSRSFVVQGHAADRGTTQIRAGVSGVAMETLDFHFSYNGDLGETQDDHAVVLRLMNRW